MTDTIDSFKGNYRFLSNSYHSPFEYEGQTYNNANEAFKAQDCDTEDFYMKNHIMYKILLAKFSDPELQDKLLKTDYASLIAGNRHHDNYWGSCTCDKCKDIEGCNFLGNYLMVVRNYYRDELEWKGIYQDPWEEIVDSLRNGERIDIEELKHLIVYTYYECEEMMGSATQFPWCYIYIYKFISQAGFFLSYNYIPDVPKEVSLALGIFINGLCEEIENGFYNGDSDLEHPLHLPNKHIDMSSDESFLKEFDEYVTSLKQALK